MQVWLKLNLVCNHVVRRACTGMVSQYMPQEITTTVRLVLDRKLFKWLLVGTEDFGGTNGGHQRWSW